MTHAICKCTPRGGQPRSSAHCKEKGSNLHVSRRLRVAHEVVHHVRDARRPSEQVRQGGREEELNQPPTAEEPRAEKLLFTPRHGVDETRRGICLV